MRARLVLALVLTVCVAALAAQQPSFRAQANYIRVDMFATAGGVPIDDLTAADVEVLEDGAAQTIATFEHVQPRPVVAQEARVEPSTVAESRAAAADPRARVFVIFLDTYHTQIEGSSTMRLPLVRFLDRLVGQDDLVAIMTPEMSARDITLGRKTTVISNIMQAQWAWGRRGRVADADPKDALYDGCYPDARGSGSEGIAAEMKDRRREMLTLDALTDLVTHLDGLRDERKAVITVSEGWRMFGENRNLARVIDPNRRATVPDPFGINQRRGSDRTPSSAVSMTECEADRNILATMNNSLRLRAISESANRANVTFYPVYARGLAVSDTSPVAQRDFSPAADRAALSTRQESLRQLADETDGIVVMNTNDIDRGLQRIVADVSSYYLIGYYTSNSRLDGKFRQITVRVRRPGVQVRARRGYRAPTAAEITDLATRPTRADGDALANAFATASALSARRQFRVRASGWTTSDGASTGGSAWIVGELDYQARRDVGWTAGAVAEVVLVDSTAKAVLTQSVDVDADTGGFTLQVPTAGVLAPGDYAIRVRVSPKQSGPVPLSDTARLIVPPGAAGMGEAVLLRRGPSTGPRFLTTADPRFRRNERIRAEHATRGDGVPTARLLDREGKPLQVPVAASVREDASGAFRWVVAEVGLGPLAPGSYALETSLGSERGVTAFSVVP